VTIWTELRYAFRQLFKAPLFSVTVLATLALCIGVNTAIYSVLDAVLIRAIPYPAPERLALLVTGDRSMPVDDYNSSQTGALYEEVRDHVSGLDCAAWARPAGANFSYHGRIEYVQQQRVGSGFFRVLGIPPRLGREFTREQDVPGGPAIAVLSYEFWERVFNADPAVLGHPIDLKGAPHVVVGIMPRGFRTTAPVDVWTPLHPSREGEGAGDNYGVTARLRPGVSWTAASEQLRALSASLRATPHFPSEIRNFEERIVPLQKALTQDTRSPLLLTWAAVLMVLVIGCVNIAGLLLARSGSRAREVATRLALGAPRGAVVRQLFLESLLLAVAGGIAGISVGGFAVDWFKQLGVGEVELWRPIDLDSRVLAVMLAGSLFTSLIFGLAPAFHATRLDIRGVLAEAGRGTPGPRRNWTRATLVAGEVALSLVLMVGAGLLVRSLEYLNRLSPGFDPHNLIAAEASLQDARYQTAVAINNLYEQSLERIQRIPGVRSAAVALTLPYERPLNNAMHTIDGGDHDDHTVEVVYITPAYFATMRIPMLFGRAFRESDTMDSEPVAVVSQSFARKYFHGDAMGRHVSLGSSPRVIVAVVGDVQQHSGITDAHGPITVEPTLYVPTLQIRGGFFGMAHTWFSPKWAIRTVGPRPNLAAEVRDAIASVDPRLPIAHFRTVDDLRGLYTGHQRYLAALFSIFAGLAVLLAAIGLYGLISQSIAQRRHELGIRLALGATAFQTIAGAVRPGLLLAASGVAAGLLGSFAATRLLRHMIFGIGETDPITFITTSTILLLIATIATLAPALRILRLDPAQTLRTE
jgi:predicted permease